MQYVNYVLELVCGNFLKSFYKLKSSADFCVSFPLFFICHFLSDNIALYRYNEFWIAILLLGFVGYLGYV